MRTWPERLAGWLGHTNAMLLIAAGIITVVAGIVAGAVAQAIAVYGASEGETDAVAASVLFSGVRDAAVLVGLVFVLFGTVRYVLYRVEQWRGEVGREG